MMSAIATTRLQPGQDLSQDETRVPWVDYAKGFCIIMVVLMNTTLGVEKAAGAVSWLNGAIAFATPFRMPDFFMIAGLFLARGIDRDWRGFLDSKVVHFLYFYLLWMTLQWGLKDAAPALGSGGHGDVLAAWLSGLWDPPGSLWFIYILPIFFVVTKLARPLPPLLVLGLAALLQVIPRNTGWYIGDQFCERFVFFLIGYYFAPRIFAFARLVGAHRGMALAGLGLWALVNGGFVVAGLEATPGIGLVLGFIGALAVIALAVLASGLPWLGLLRECGRNSLAIYLAFFLPMASLRVVLLKWGGIADLGTISLLITVIAVLSPLVMQRMAHGTRLAFLFERPAFARLGGGRRRPSLQPAE